ncbi:MAG: hypothetical protein WBG36_10900 [Ornithinimicrobium sp.]
MPPDSDAAIEPEAGRPPDTADAEVNDALREFDELIAAQPEPSADAKVAAAAEAHRRLQVILTADRG